MPTISLCPEVEANPVQVIPLPGIQHKLVAFLQRYPPGQWVPMTTVLPAVWGGRGKSELHALYITRYRLRQRGLVLETRNHHVRLASSLTVVEKAEPPRPPRPTRSPRIELLRLLVLNPERRQTITWLAATMYPDRDERQGKHLVWNLINSSRDAGIEFKYEYFRSPRCTLQLLHVPSDLFLWGEVFKGLNDG